MEKIALDNIDAHYHRMGYISSLNVDYVKIEASFIEASKDDENIRNTLEAIILLSHNSTLQKQVIAIKTEHKDDVEKIEELEFDCYQGMLLKDENETF